MKKFLEIAYSTTLALALFGLYACSSDDKDKHTGGATEETQIAIEDKTIAGVSEKGPFMKGSAVRLYELNARNLGQTGRAFTGKIASDRGDFRFTHLNLESQYVLLEANGFYRNEVNGLNSAASISLNALVDVSDRETANINLLTHLAYERMQHLVDDGSSVAEAKRQAEQEILKAFHVADESIEGFEELSIFESGKGNATLLAISILMQGDLSEAEFSERLADFAYDIEDDGVWDDSVTATKIADWASARSIWWEYYAFIRKNMENWELSDTIPEFEKSLDKFWWENYGLGDCDKKTEGELRENTNGLSELAHAAFRCREGRWFMKVHEDWKSYTDSVDKGVSTISFRNAGDTIKATFDIGKKIGYDYAGLDHWLNERGEPEDYSNCEVIKYSYKGNGHKFVVGSPLNSSDGDYYIYIRGSNEWKNAYVPWDYLREECWNVCYNGTIEETRKQVTDFTWHFGETGSIEITGIGCIDRKGYLEAEKLEEPCESGEMKIAAVSERTFICSDKVWKPVACGDEGTEGKVLGDQICLCSRWYEKDCDKHLENNGNMPGGYSCSEGKWISETIAEDGMSFVCSEK